MDDAVKKDASISIYTIGFILANLCYCYFICSTIPKGFSRLISLLPIFSVFAVLPLRLLSAAVGLTLALFAGTLISIKLAEPPTSKPPKKTIRWSYIAVEYASFAAVYGLLLFKKDELHPVVLLLLYCSLPLLAVDCLGVLSSLMLYGIIGLDLKPSSDKPYLATSVQDFWGKRWNHAVNNCLRCTVYLPVRSKSAVILGKRWARLAAVMATFLVSGLLHEVHLYYLTRAKPRWEMTSFFVVHGFCVALEVEVKKYCLNGRFGLPGWVSRPLTIGFVALTGYWLFFPPLIRSGFGSVVHQEVQSFVHCFY